MPAKAIISYDDTLNDHDALMLGRLLASAGAELMLAYVRHTTQVEHDREELEEHEAERLLERGARWLDDLDVERRVVVSASTGEGLGWLAEQEEADVVVFGSDYRTAAGHVSLQHSAWTLLERGPRRWRSPPRLPPATATREIAPDRRARGSRRRGRDRDRLSPGRAASTRVVVDDERGVDLLVVGSRAEAPEGRVMLSSQAQHAIEDGDLPGASCSRGARWIRTLVTA